MKKLTSWLLSLLLCISLLPVQAHAADIPEDVEPPAVVEAVEPEEPMMPLSEEVPDRGETNHF